MIYEIVEIVEPTQLQKREMIGYSTKVSTRSVLQSIDLYGFNPYHSSMDEAHNEIINNRNILKSKNLTIIPIISIDLNGDIR